MTTLRRALHPETRVLDSRRGIVEYIASDETIDRDREIIRADGWRFTHFSKNAPFVDSHDYSSIGSQLGKVVDFRVVNKRLVETVQWAIDVPENKLANIGWKMTEGGYLKAVSVGFIPTQMVRKGDAGYQSQLKSLGLQDSPTAPRTIFVTQEQTELSACLIGVNPNALATLSKALRHGVISDSEFELCSSRSAPQADPAESDAVTKMKFALRFHPFRNR